jgi:putative spermidine/putrescine transport system permease protein
VFDHPRLGTWLTLPAAVFVGGAFVLPVLILLSGSLQDASGAWSIGRYLEFAKDPLSVEVFWRTLKLGALVTLTCAALGYAAALAMVQSGPRWKGRWVGLVVLPLMISPVARTYAWIVILGRTGIVNQAIVGLGLSPEPLRILFTETAVFIGLVQLFLPLMILSLVSALENLPPDVVPAARVLGASWPTAFFKVILPLTREGLVTGGTLVFAGAVTAYITPAVLGGSKVLMLETLLYQKVSVQNDFVAASVIAAILIAMGVVTHALLRRMSRGRK